MKAIGAGSGIIQLSAGGAHMLALKSNGTVLAWGNNQLNQPASAARPVSRARCRSPASPAATQVAAGLDVSFATHTVPYLVGL